MRLTAWIGAGMMLAAGVPSALAQPGSPPSYCDSFNFSPGAPQSPGPPPACVPRPIPPPGPGAGWDGRVGTFGDPPVQAPPPGRLQVAIIGGDGQYAARLTGGVRGRLGLVADVGSQPRSGDAWRVYFRFKDPASAELVTGVVFEEECGSRNGRYCHKASIVGVCSASLMTQCVDNVIGWIQNTARGQ